MPRHKKEIDDGLDTSSGSDKELFEISDTLLLEEKELFEDPSRRHKRRKFTKEDAYLGIWAEPEEDRPNRKKRDVRFVSSTSKSVTIENDTAEKDIEQFPVEPKDERDAMGTRRIEVIYEEDDDRRSIGSSFSQIDDLDEEPLTTKKEMFSFASSSSSTRESTTLDEMLNMQFSSTKSKGKRKSQFTPQFKESSSIDKDFGNFEKHTKGIGLKLMQKMGYKIGEGLGSDGRGIVNPIETQLRPARMGLAYHGFKEKTNQVREDEKSQDLVDEDEVRIKPAKKEKSNAWKKSAKAKKSRVTYKTADEIVNEIGSGPSVQPIKIIDMTGPQVREISSNSQISSQAIPDTSTRLPELRHNLRLIVDMSKADLEHFTRERHIQSERTKTLKNEMARVTAQVNDETTKINRLGEIMSIIKDCSRHLTVSLSSDSPSLELFSDAFEKLHNKYSNEFTLYNLDAAVIAIITPVIKQIMINWDPLEDPNFGLLLEFQKWKGLFKTNPPITNAPSHRFNHDPTYKRFSEITMTPYESMMYSVWLPKIRSAINNMWDTRDYDPAIKLLENWKPPLLPVFIYDNIIDQLIMPKLTREVDSWNPNTDTQMIHQWLHPWLPLLRERMEPLYSTIRQKFRSSLQRWDPIDTSAFDIIEPWNNVFKLKDMQSLIVKYVLPKLTETMKTRLQINPKNQELDVFNCTMIWRNLFTPKVFNQLFEDTFFVKWLDALYIWLTHNPNYDEIRQWYLFWKSLFPKEMLDSPIIEEQFTKALCMIEESISLGSEASTRLSHPSQKGTIPEPEQFRFLPEEPTGYTDIADITFFEIVEEFAQDQNFLFLPTNKTHDSGKPLYRMGGTPEGVGGLLMYLSDDVMYVKESQNWTPMGFDEVLEKLESSKRRQ